MLSPRLRYVAPHNTGFRDVMGLGRAYDSLLAMCNVYEKQILACFKLHTKVADPLDPDGYVCAEDGEDWPCTTRKVMR